MKRDKNISEAGFTYSRCAGVCDDDTGACYCDGTIFGRIPRSPTDAPGTTPYKEGRPLMGACRYVSTDSRGNPVNWGGRGVPYEKLYGPQGWCNSNHPLHLCDCILDGYGGTLCTDRFEMVCPNQCSGRGECQRGWCRCFPGWYGADCAKFSAGAAVRAAEAVLSGEAANLGDAIGDALASTAAPQSTNGSAAAEGAAVAARADAGGEVAQGRDGGGADMTTLFAIANTTYANLLTSRPWLFNLTVDVWEQLQPKTSSNSVPEHFQQVFRRSRTHLEAVSAVGAAAGAPRRSLQRHFRTGAGGGGGFTVHVDGSITANVTCLPGADCGAEKKPADLELGKRQRPLIYVYDISSRFVGHMLQYRMEKKRCTWRLFNEKNWTTFVSSTAWAYGSEQHLHELLLQSEHRTLDPKEADFFYVPVYSACYIDAVEGFADYPWFFTQSDSRIKQLVVMYREALRWVQTAYPYWNASGGADHVWLFPHDEGACWAPAEIYNNSIILSHWGRAGLDHKSTSSRFGFNYNIDTSVGDDPQVAGFWRFVQQHPCYTPGKDLILPSVRSPLQISLSPFLGGDHRKRDILALLRGDMGAGRPASYSGGVRQQLAALAKSGAWKDTHNVWIGTDDELSGDYSLLMSRAAFCLVVPGDGWTPLFEDAVLHGCIPVVVADMDLHGPFGDQLKWGGFSLRLRIADLPRLPQLLADVPGAVLEHMRRRMTRVWHRFAWLSHPMVRKAAWITIEKNAERYPWVAAAAIKASSAAAAAGGAAAGGEVATPVLNGLPVRVLQQGDVQDDAFHTMLQWLHHLIPLVRKEGGAAARREWAAAMARTPTPSAYVIGVDVGPGRVPAAVEESDQAGISHNLRWRMAGSGTADEVPSSHYPAAATAEQRPGSAPQLLVEPLLVEAQREGQAQAADAGKLGQSTAAAATATQWTAPLAAGAAGAAAPVQDEGLLLPQDLHQKQARLDEQQRSHQQQQGHQAGSGGAPASDSQGGAAAQQVSASPTTQAPLVSAAQPSAAAVQQPGEATPQQAGGGSASLQPAAGATAQPAASTTAQPATSTVPQPAASTTAQPAASTVPQPAAGTTAQPATSTTAQPAASTTAQPVASTTAQPATSTVPQPAAGATAQPATGTAAQPTSSTVPQPSTGMPVPPATTTAAQTAATSAAQPAASGLPQPTTGVAVQPVTSANPQPVPSTGAQPADPAAAQPATAAAVPAAGALPSAPLAASSPAAQPSTGTAQQPSGGAATQQPAANPAARPGPVQQLQLQRSGDTAAQHAPTDERQVPAAEHHRQFTGGGGRYDSQEGGRHPGGLHARRSGGAGGGGQPGGAGPRMAGSSEQLRPAQGAGARHGGGAHARLGVHARHAARPGEGGGAGGADASLPHKRLRKRAHAQPSARRPDTMNVDQ